MSSQSPYQAPESPQWPSQPQVDNSPRSDRYPPPQPAAENQQQVGYVVQQSYPQQPGYVVPQPYLPMQPQLVMYQPAPHQSKGLAIASLVLGIIGVLTSWVIVGLPVSIVGLSLAIPAVRRIQGKGMAKAGLVLSIIGVVIGVIVLL